MRVGPSPPILLAAVLLLTSCGGHSSTFSPSASPATPVAPSTATLPAGPSTPATWQLPLDYLSATALRRFFVQPDSNRIWVAGSGCNPSGACQGFIQSSDDAGRTWQIQYHGLAAVNGIQFADAQHGWAWGPSADPPAPSLVLLRTRSGGRDWQPVGTFADPVNAFAFTGAKTGWVATGACAQPTDHTAGAAGPGPTCNGDLFHTADGGATWTARAHFGLPVLAVQFLGDQGWALQSGQTEGKTVIQILYTTDEGDTWIPLGDVPFHGSPFPNQADLQFFDRTEGWLTIFNSAGCAMHGCNPADAYHTTDGGRTWELVTLPLHSEQDEPCGPAQAPVLVTIGHRTAAVIRGTSLATCRPPATQLFLTTDGGDNWQLGHAWPGLYPTQLSWQPGGSAWALSPQALLYSADGGRTWSQRLPALRPTRTLQFTGDQDGWGLGLAGDTGAVLRTWDGGNTWQEIGTIPGVTVNSGSFLPDGSGWVAAQMGLGQWAVYGSTDAGHTWTALWRLTDPVIALRFVNQQEGILVNSKAVLVTHDGGRTWNRQADLPVMDYQPAADFADLQQGWVTGIAKEGNQHALLHTADGGVTWQTVTLLPAANTSMPVRFVGENGWVGVPSYYTRTGSEGQLTPVPASLLTTADGGRTWRSRTLGPAPDANGQLPASPVDVDLLNRLEGWLITSTAELWRTHDGGATWAPAIEPNPKP